SHVDDSSPQVAAKITRFRRLHFSTGRQMLTLPVQLKQSPGDRTIPPPYPRRPQAPPQFTGPRYNEFIQSQKVRVIDENGENLGVMYTSAALEQAQEVGLDLVEISPNSDPPVAKFLDIGRYKYEAQKKAAEQRKKQK